MRAGELDEARPRRRVTRRACCDAGRTGANAAGAARPERRRFDVDAHHALARAAAARVRGAAEERRRAAAAAAGRRAARVAVIGEFARTPRYQGAGSSQVNPTRLDTALDELARPGAGRRRGCLRPRSASRRHSDDEALGRRSASQLAGAPRRVVVRRSSACPPATSPRASTGRTWTCRADQTALLAAVAAANSDRGGGAGQRRRRSAVATGSSTRRPSWNAGCPARPPGGAVADLLLGVANPSGRLAETIPLRLEDNPSYLNFPGEEGHVRYGEGVFVGYRGYDAPPLPVSFPFGHGLSYTTFDYADLAADVTGRADGRRPDRHVQLPVTNTGQRPAGRSCSSTCDDPECSGGAAAP